MNITGRSAVLLAALVAAGSGLLAATKPLVHTTRSGLAVSGYDAVAYFTLGRPVRGDARLEYRWNGAVWRFASAEHRARFVAAPHRYAPRFGGYCAYAVSQGYTADGNPAYWRIVDDVLYLNYSARAQRLWEEDIPGHIATGLRHWPGVLSR